MKKATWFLISLIMATVSCQSAPTPMRPMPTPLQDIQKAAIRVGNLDRDYLYYVPANLPRNAPLLFVFHGYGYDAATMRAYTGNEFESLADQNGFVVVYPMGFVTSWNDCRNPLPLAARAQNMDDVGFVDALIARFRADYSIDTPRVFATGHSNGGQMAFRLAFELPDEITAIAAVAASLPVEGASLCRVSENPIPVLIMNGTGDPAMPYDGGLHTGFGTELAAFRSTQATVEYFVKLNKLTSPPKTARLPHRDASDPTFVERIVWNDAGKPEVVLVKINGGGHLVPQSENPWPEQYGRTTGDLEGPVEIWNFFSRQRSLK